ncbi:hypothetical protein RND81_10G196700 [Saponaria officinalis]|uniref:Uncharacterized protein n=1 Tax=Saponaria officinalis TaxID=3572 RepID=A0AAW1I6Q8_SAPOF
MAGNQLSGDGLASNLAGMSKTQLYDIMCQMKLLIDQNQQQARDILVHNPLLTRALFQAQIMLGMVQPSSNAVPSVQPQSSQQSSLHVKQSNVHVANAAPSQTGLQDQANMSQTAPVRKQQQNQPPMPISSTPVQGILSQSVQPAEQSRGHFIPQATQMQHPKSSQVPNMPSLPLNSGSLPPSAHHPPLPPMPGHLQQQMQTTGVSHHMPQPPLPAQPRPPIQMPYQPQVSSNVNFQNAGIRQMHPPQPMFHPSSRPSGAMGPYSQGQPPLSNQPSHQQIYQGGGTHLGSDFSNQGGSNMQMDRGSSWPHAPRDNSSGAQLPTLPPLGPGPMPVGNQPRPPPLAPDVEQALIQQVMSLTQEQINLLPPEQRQQVLQLQQMLRQ